MECPDSLPAKDALEGARPPTRGQGPARLYKRPKLAYALLTLALAAVLAVLLSLVLDPSLQDGRVMAGALFSNVAFATIPLSLMVAISAALSVFAEVGRGWKWAVLGTFAVALLQLLGSWMAAFEGGALVGFFSLLASALTFAYGDVGEAARDARREDRVAVPNRRDTGSAQRAAGLRALFPIARWRPFALMALGTLAFRLVVGL